MTVTVHGFESRSVLPTEFATLSIKGYSNELNNLHYTFWFKTLNCRSRNSETIETSPFICGDLFLILPANSIPSLVGFNPLFHNIDFVECGGWATPSLSHTHTTFSCQKPTQFKTHKNATCSLGYSLTSISSLESVFRQKKPTICIVSGITFDYVKTCMQTVCKCSYIHNANVVSNVY